MGSQAEISEARAPAGGPDGSSFRRTWVQNHIDTLVALGLLVIVIACAVFDRHAPVRRFFTVDDSWSLDLFFKAHQGSWVGKDFAFSYGPLYQWLLGISEWGQGVSLGTFFRLGHLGLFAYTIGMVWLSARLLLRQEPSWKRGLVIAGFAIPWTYFEVREATIVLLFALMLRLFDRTAESRSHYAWPAAAGSAAIAFSFLLSGDTGIYGIIALLTVAASYCACRRSDAGAWRRILRLAACMCAGLACWCALIGIFMGIQFWRDTLALAGTYRWAMATPFIPADEKWNLLLVVGICFGVFAAAGRGRKDKGFSLAARPAFQLAAPLFSLACLQSSLVRSDWYHVFFGWFAAIALAAFSLFAARNSSSLLSTLRIAGGFALLVVYIYPPATFLPVVVASALASTSRQVTECPSGTRPLDGVCLGHSPYLELQGVATHLQAQSTTADSVAIFPDENIFGDLARRRVAGGVLQNYAAAGNVLVDRQLQGLEEQKPALAV